MSDKRNIIGPLPDFPAQLDTMPDKRKIVGPLPDFKFSPAQLDTMSDKRNIVVPDFSPKQLDTIALFLYRDKIGVQNTRSAFLEKAKGVVGSIVKPSYSRPEELAELMWYEHLRVEGLKLPEDIKAKIAPKLPLGESTSSVSAPYVQPRETAITQLPVSIQKVIETEIGDVEDSTVGDIGNDKSVTNEVYPGENPPVQSTSLAGVSTPKGPNTNIRSKVGNVKNSKLSNIGNDNTTSNRFYLPLFILIPLLLLCFTILPTIGNRLT